MNVRNIYVSACAALVCTPILVISIPVVFAQVMQSTNYHIQEDSVNFSGGLSTSTNYTLQSTAGEVGTGDLTSTTFNLHGGYQQMVNTFIAMTAVGSVTMTPSIPGISGGVANGSTTVTVTTDSSAGYRLTIAAQQSPALRNESYTIADYAPALSDPDYTFTTNSTDAHFGFSPEGIDISQRFKDDGVSCNTGALETAGACWDGLSTTEKEIARRTSANTPGGSSTRITFRVGIGGSAVQPNGVYTATTTLTALSL